MTVASENELFKKITARLVAGGYFFLFVLSIRLIIATINVQNRKRLSQVTNISITSLIRGRQKDLHFLADEEATATVWCS